MDLFFDGSIFSLQSMGGINRYFANLISHLPESYGIELTTTTINEISFPQHKNLVVHRFPRFGFRPGRLSYWAEGRYFRHRLDESSACVFHPTYYSFLSQVKPSKVKIPTVATIFDLVHERYPAMTDPDGSIRRAKRALIARADIILCLSHHTKNDIEEYYGVPASRVRVTYPGSSIDVAPHAERSTNEAPYFMFVGNRWTYKNFPLFLKAFASIRTRNSKLRAVVVGPRFTPEERILLTELGLLTSVDDVGYLPDQNLSRLFSGAIALVYPSTFEGFGFPILEAMTCGTPVITTKIASIPEVVGDAGILVGIEYRDELISAMERIMQDEDLRKSCRERGYSWAAKFSWRDCAAKTMAIYEEIGL